MIPPSPSSTPSRLRIRLLAAGALVVALLALAVAWSATPLGHLLDPQVLAAHAGRVRAWPLAPLVVVPAFIVLGLVAAPGSLLIAATLLLFGAWPGVLYAYAGMMANGLVVYTIGRHAARESVDAWLARRAGSKLDALDELLARRGFVAVAVLRVSPIPYSIQNVVIGASRVGVRDFVLGTLVGLMPVTAILTGFAAGLDAWIARPDWNQVLAVGAGGVAVLAIVWSVRRRFSRGRHEVGRDTWRR